METVTAWLKARKFSSTLAPVVGLAIALCTVWCCGAAHC